MTKLLKNIEYTWWKVSTLPLRNECKLHIINTIPWRYEFIPHHWKGCKVTTIYGV